MTPAKDSNEPATGLKGKALVLKDRVVDSHAARMGKHYGANSGNVLSGGIAYFSLTSLAAGLVILATISSYFLDLNQEARDATTTFLNEAIPGIVSGNGDEDGLVEQGSLSPPPISGIVGVVAFLVLFFTATRYIGGLRQGVKMMLGNEVATGVSGKLRDFVALAAIAGLLLLGVVLQVVAAQAEGLVENVVSDDPLSSWVLRGPALAVTLVVDALFVLIAIRFLGRAEVTFKKLLPVIGVAAVAMGLLRLGSSSIISGVADNPVLGSFAAIITILIFADFVARIILMASAWLGTADQLRFDTPDPDKVEGVTDEAGGPISASDQSSQAAS